MADTEDLFREKHEGPSFTTFDEDTIAHVSSKYKHLKIYFWDGSLPMLRPSAIHQFLRFS